MNNLVDITILNDTNIVDIDFPNNGKTLIQIDEQNLISFDLNDNNTTITTIDNKISITEFAQQGLTGPPGDTILNDLIISEIPSGIINGINSIFTTQFNFIPETVEIYLNGLKQRIIEDYQLIGNNTIQFVFSPFNNENILVNYLKQ